MKQNDSLFGQPPNQNLTYFKFWTATLFDVAGDVRKWQGIQEYYCSSLHGFDNTGTAVQF